jgi:arylsulfatase A-like enzyme
MHVADWFPTIAALVGYQPATDLRWDGINQWPALIGEAPGNGPRTIYIAMKGGQALRHGDWKLIVDATGEPQLFNIAADPFENNDLAQSEPQRIAELSKLLAEQKSKDEPNLPADMVGLPK